MAKRGAKPLYKPEFAEMARAICAETGAIDTQLAKIFKVSFQSINTWKKKYPEFGLALKEGKDEFDTSNVEEKLLQRAMGYKYTENHYQKSQKTGKMVLIKKVEKQIPPDVTAQIYWTKNRNPERWRDVRHDVHDVGKSTMAIVAKLLNKDGTGSD